MQKLFLSIAIRSLQLLHGIDLDARAHGGSRHTASDILALCGGRLCLDDRVNQRGIVVEQLLGTKGNFANRAVDDIGLIETVLNLTCLLYTSRCV